METTDGTPHDETTVSLKFVLLVVAAVTTGLTGAWGFHKFLATHVEFHLTPKAAAAELDAKILSASTAAKSAAEAAQKIGSALEMHISEEKLSKARELLSAKREQLSTTQLWETANRPNDISRARKVELQGQIDVLREYVRCLEQFRSVCVSP